MSKESSSPLLELRNLSKHFGGDTVLSGVDLKLEEGTVTALIGKSGSGKTVLLKCIAGLLQPDDGEIYFEGETLRGEGATKRARHRWSSRMSYLFQGDALFSSLTAWENVALPLREGPPMAKSEMADRVGALFEKLDLGAMGSKYPGELSGGMRRRVALARALVMEPRVVLFDEPTTGLDPVRRNAVLEMIYRDRERFGFTALVVSHDVPECLYISDRVAILNQGRIETEGRPTDLDLTDPALQAGASFLENERDLVFNLAGVSGIEALESSWSQLVQEHDQLLLLQFPAGAEVMSDLILPSAIRNTIALVQDVGKRSQVFGLSRRELLVGVKANDLGGLLDPHPGDQVSDEKVVIRVRPADDHLSKEEALAALRQAPPQGCRSGQKQFNS